MEERNAVGRDTVDAMLLALGERMGMPGLRADAAGACQLLFDQRWLVTLLHVPAAGCLALHCPVTRTGEAAHLDSGHLQAMLRASFLGVGAGGATLCIGPDQRAYLQRLLPLGAGDGLQQALEQLLDHAEGWSARLQHTGEPAAAADWSFQRV